MGSLLGLPSSDPLPAGKSPPPHLLHLNKSHYAVPKNSPLLLLLLLFLLFSRWSHYVAVAGCAGTHRDLRSGSRGPGLKACASVPTHLSLLHDLVRWALWFSSVPIYQVRKQAHGESAACI